MVPTHLTFSGMRGLPALIWDGSVLDAGALSCLIYPRPSLMSIQRRAFVSVVKLFRKSRTCSPRRREGRSLSRRDFSGSWSLVKFLPRSKLPSFRVTGLHAQPFPSSSRKFLTAALPLFTP